VPTGDHHRLVVAPWCGLGSGSEEALVGEAGTASAKGGGCSSSYMVAQFSAQYALYALLGGPHAWAAGGDVDEFLGAGVGDRVALPRGPAGALLAGALAGVPAHPAGSPPDHHGGGREDGALLAPWVDFRLAPADRDELTRRVVAGAPLRLETGGGSCESPAGQGKPGLHCAAGVAFSIHDVVVLRPRAGGGLAGADRDELTRRVVAGAPLRSMAGSHAPAVRDWVLLLGAGRVGAHVLLRSMVHEEQDASRLASVLTCRKRLHCPNPRLTR